MTDDPCTRHLVAGDDGAQLEGCAHGGQITGWFAAGEQDSRLWLSPATGCGPADPIRGGVPVVFPQFGTLGALRKHGFARDRDWRLNDTSSPDARLSFDTTISGEPGWPHRARLTLDAVARGASLAINLQVVNVGQTSFEWTVALHAYLTVADTETARIEGLNGRQALDAMAGGRALRLPNAPLSPAGPHDLMVRDHAGPLVLRDPARSPLQVSATGFGDWVVWNPGPAHQLADVVSGDERHFVCMEPAVLAPRLLDPDESWTGTLRLMAD